MATSQEPTKQPDFGDIQASCKCGKGASGEGRNLVVCIDGTSNQFSTRVRGPQPFTCRLLLTSMYIEHECCRIVQPAGEERKAADVLQQWNWHLRQALLALLGLHMDAYLELA